MYKIWIFVQSDGIKNTLKFIWKSVAGRFFHLSRTLCLYANEQNICIKKRNAWDAYHCRIITKVGELEILHFDRLKLLPYQRWLENGSMVIVLFKDDIPVAFGWTHFKKHAINYVGSFEMGEDIAWLGPSFVSRKHRGQGLQQWVIQEGIKNAPANIKTFITSINAGNRVSLHSFEKCGFKVGLEVHCKTVFFTTKSSKIKILDEDSKRYLRIKNENNNFDS